MIVFQKNSKKNNQQFYISYLFYEVLTLKLNSTSRSKGFQEDSYQKGTKIDTKFSRARLFIRS